ncbi:L-rhamnose mutarotase [Cytospora mali]|uniref:L-rhamnose mutarotase n=1 Tax=Cytospora mali TaxID=578113 RepID=A0A194W8F0_CYTMA|nr:L-rhamnose mutarotase [Valsa mali]
MSSLWTNQSAPALWSKPSFPPGEAHTPSATPLSEDQTRVRHPGRRFAQIVKLKPECYDKYKEVHAAVWSEVSHAIKASNIVDYSIFYDDQTHILFATFKYVGYNYEGDMETMRENPKVREWWKMTDELQESMVPGATSSEAGQPAWWKPVEEVFYLA